MLKRNQTNKIILSLDSDVLVAMAYLDLIKNNPKEQDNEFEKNQDALNIKKKRMVVEKLLEMHENEEIDFFISPPVYVEWRFSPTVKAFVENKCFMPELDENGEFILNKEVKELADHYIRPTEIVNKDGRVNKCPPAMNSQYNAGNDNLYEPTSDVYVMAWSAVFGFHLITNNFIHFISYGTEFVNTKTGKKQIDTRRRFNIRIVNKQQGYVIQKKNGQDISASPYGLADIASILVDSTLDFAPSDTEGLTRADQIISILEENYRKQDEIYKLVFTETKHDQLSEDFDGDIFET